MRIAPVFTLSAVLILQLKAEELSSDLLSGNFRTEFPRQFRIKKEAVETRNTNIKSAKQEVKQANVNLTKTRSVKAQIGTTARLPCLVHGPNLSNVTWVRASDNSILTYGNTTFAQDRRFYTETPELLVSDRGNQFWRWNLLIALVNPSDNGPYDCFSINTTTGEKTDMWRIYLTVIEAYAEILGDPEKMVRVGSTLRLSCLIENELEPPQYIFWYHRDRMINFDMTNGINIRIGRLGSELVIPRADSSHSGNYSCVPSNARPANVTVTVFKDNRLPLSLSQVSAAINVTGWHHTLVLLIIAYIIVNKK